MKRSAAVLAATIAMVLGGEAASLEGAERTKRVCRERVSLRHAPAGVRIGYLHRGDRVIVVTYARRRHWAYVLSGQGYGWLLTRALCRR
jgi:hypothetical protein